MEQAAKPGDRGAYEAPELTVIASVEEATLSSAETGSDALSQFSPGA